MDVRNVRLDPEAVRDYAAAKDINSVAELSRRSKIDRSNLDRFLSGDRPTLPRHVFALSRTLGCKPSVLLHESEAALGELMDAAESDDPETVAS